MIELRIAGAGDAYMACSGVVTPKEHHQRDLVRCALDFQLATSTFYTTVRMLWHPLHVPPPANSRSVLAALT
jgi:hypothetical protein